MGLLQGDAAIVTGAGRGLGRAYAMALALEGARVVVNDVDVEEAHRVAQEITDAGGAAVPDGANISHWDAAEGVVERCVDEFGALNVLVNNAGIYRIAPLWEATEHDLDATIAVNLKGTFAMARHAARVMIPNKRGCIINVTSGAQSGLAGRSIYSASKAGVAGLTYTLSLELAPYGIRVNAISPLAYTRMSETSDAGGYPTTAKTPPETVAPLVVFLASQEAANVTGQVVRLEGNSLSLVSHPRSVHPAIHSDGWNVGALKQFFATTLGRHLEPVGLAVDTYAYYSGVGQP